MNSVKIKLTTVLILRDHWLYSGIVCRYFFTNNFPNQRDWFLHGNFRLLMFRFFSLNKNIFLDSCEKNNVLFQFQEEFARTENDFLWQLDCCRLWKSKTATGGRLSTMLIRKSRDTNEGPPPWMSWRQAPHSDNRSVRKQRALCPFELSSLPHRFLNNCLLKAVYYWR